MRILLVEDDKLIGDGIKAGLSKMGFSIDWFTAGLEGKNALYSAPYDAAILDLTLPGIDGLDILREWRDKGRHEPVLILTARDALSQRVEGLRLGADDYLCKPFALIEVARPEQQRTAPRQGDPRSEPLNRQPRRRKPGAEAEGVRPAGTAYAQRRARIAA